MSSGCLSSEEMPPGGVFALPSKQKICAAHDLCLGITAQQELDPTTI